MFVICGMWCLALCWSRLRDCGLPVKHRINCKILLLTFKAPDGLALSYIQNLTCVKGKSNYNPRSNSDTILGIPRKTLKTFSNTAFCMAAPSLCSKLPRNICEVKNLETFKSVLKTHLFKEAFVTVHGKMYSNKFPFNG